MTALARSLVALLLLLPAAPAAAGLSRSALSEVHLSPQPGAELPLDLVLQDHEGHAVTLKEAIGGKPTLLLPVDYRCKTTCGPAVSIISSVLAESGLHAGTDYRLVMVGLNPRDDAATARQFVESRLGDEALAHWAEPLTANAAALQRLTTAIGYRYAFDAGTGAFAHPAALVAVTGDGKVTRALSSLALGPTDLRLALLEAGEGRIGGVIGQLTLLCYGFDAAHGVYTSSVTFILKVGAALTVAAIAAMVALLAWRTRRREEA
jgi:protein SCO1/2